MEAFSETNMQTGAIISGWGHLIVIGLAALSGPIFEDSKDNELIFCRKDLKKTLIPR